MKKSLVKKKIENMSIDECKDILENLNHWQWDSRLGKEPVKFSLLNNYKKPHNLKFRLETLFRAIWPFTKENYVQPIRHEIFKKFPELDRLKDFF